MEALLIRLAISAAANYVIPRVVEKVSDKWEGRQENPRPSWDQARKRALRQEARRRRKKGLRRFRTRK